MTNLKIFNKNKTGNNKLNYYDSALKIPNGLQEILEISRYRFLLSQLVRRDILTRYKRSYLGVIWTMLNPLGTMIVMTIVFSNFFGGTHAYPVYLLSGLLTWNFFSKSTSAAMHSMVWGSDLFKRIFLPKTSFCISSVGTEVVNILLSFVPLMLVMIFTKSAFHISLVFLPISIVLLSCFALGVALLVSSLAIYFPDVAEMYQIILTAWMYLTPIIYTIDIFPAKYRWLLSLNPMTYMVKLFQIPIYDGRFPTLVEFWPAALWGIGILIFGWFFFTRKIDEYAYHI